MPMSAGLCHDYLNVSESQTTTNCFGECGATGKQVISVQSSTADINFVAAETSSTQRGFFLYYEGNELCALCTILFIIHTPTVVLTNGYWSLICCGNVLIF